VKGDGASSGGKGVKATGGRGKKEKDKGGKTDYANSKNDQMHRSLIRKQKPPHATGGQTRANV